jgi:UDP-apiose/xylose synthase
MTLKKVIVLGCGGFVGSHLVDRLLADGGYEVAGWDVTAGRVAGHLGHERFQYHEAYIDADNVFDQFEPIVDEYDAVVSLAAICNPAQYVSDPLRTIQSNFLDAYKLVDLCSKKRKWLIHTSTCEVYGRTISSYLPEDEYGDPRLYEQVEDETPLVVGPVHNQRWCYSSAKQLLERYIYAHHTERGLPFTMIRPYNWFGPRMDFIPGRDGDGVPRVLACFMTALLDGKPLQLVDGGHARRTITYIQDAIDALVLMLEKPAKAKGQTFNIGNRGGEIAMCDLAEMMRELYAEITGDPAYRKHPIEVVSGDKFYGPGYEDCDRRVPDVSKAEKLLGWRAKTNLRDTLRATMTHYHEVYGKPQAATEASQKPRRPARGASPARPHPSQG